MENPLLCFNPCFSGYGLQRVFDIFFPFIPREFQSLFFWIWPSKSLWNCIWVTFAEFQSLFFWIWPSKITTSPLSREKLVCFNPCFSGYGLQSPATSPTTIPFCGFNPCFSGYGLQSCHFCCNYCRCCKFQSLFFWICPSKFRKRILKSITHVFQSLFFWIWPSKSL